MTITGTTKLVPTHLLNSIQFIRRSGTCRCPFFKWVAAVWLGWEGIMIMISTMATGRRFLFSIDRRHVNSQSRAVAPDLWSQTYNFVWFSNAQYTRDMESVYSNGAHTHKELFHLYINITNQKNKIHWRQNHLNILRRDELQTGTILAKSS